MHKNIIFTEYQEKVMEETRNYMGKLDMIPKEDYDIYFVNYIELDNSNSETVIKLQFEEEPTMLNDMNKLGWEIEARYINDNGCPSKFCNGEFNDSFGDYGDYKMIRMIVK